MGAGGACHELYGKTVGLVGMGAIGRQVAEYLHVFGAKILYTDLCQLSSEQEQKLYATYISSLEEMLPLVDILSFHCPLTNDNKEILNERTLSMMKSDAIIVNTARGKLIEEVALYKALKNGKVRAAGLDVHYEEPISINNHLLSTSDNVILTPHIGGLSFETFHAMMKDAVENIVLYEEGNTEMLQNKLL